MANYFDDLIPTPQPSVSKRENYFDDLIPSPTAPAASAPPTAPATPALPWTDVARSLSSASLNALINPIGALSQAVPAELLRLGVASSQLPSFQRYAPQLGSIVRQPIQLLGLPTEVSAGFAPGTPLNPIARYVEQQAQNTAAAGFGDLLAQEALFGLLGTGAGALRGVGQVIRRSMGPELLPPVRPIVPERPILPIVEAEIVEPPRALPAPAQPAITPRSTSTAIALTQQPPSVIRPPIRVTTQPEIPVLSQLSRIRSQAIKAVTTELREQSVLLNSERLNLRKRVLESGGIKPTLAGGLREELQAIRPFLRQQGRPIDDLATELGFENGEALRDALISGQGARIPRLAELRQQAIQIVDSEHGNRILEAIQAKGATGKAITAVVKDVTRQAAQELALGQRQVRGILTAAQRQAMTPAQLARFAREQRMAQGETVPGPQGAPQEPALAPEEIAQITKRIGGIVPRHITEAQRARLAKGLFVRFPGGPNQPPPILSTSKALVPSGFHAQRDVPVSFTRATSEVDIQRAAQFVDGGKLLGPVNQRVVQPVLQADARAVVKAEATRKAFRRLTQHIKPDSPQDAKLLRAAEDQLASGETLTPQEHALVEQWVAFRQRALEEVNRALVRIGKKPLTGRQDYAPHLPTLVFLGDLFGDLTNVPDEVLQHLPWLRPIFDTPIGQRDPNLPAAVRNLPYIPKHQRAFFLHPRVGGPYRESLVAGINAYIPLWARLTEVAPVVQSSKAMLSQLPPNFKVMAEQWLAEQVGRKPQADLLIDAKAMQSLTRLQRLSSSSFILGRVSTVLLQFSSMANTAARHGWLYAMRGFQKASTPQGRAFAEHFSRELQQRMSVGTLLDGDTSAVRIANAALEMADQQMVAADFLAAVERYTKMPAARFNQITGSDPTFENILSAADISAEQTQASMRRALQSPVLRSQLLRATASQLQTFNVNLRQQQFLDPRLLAMATSRKDAALYVAKLDANLLVMNMLYRFFGLRAPTDPSDFIPIFDPFTGGVPIGPISKAVYSGGRFVPAASLVASLVFLIAKDAQEDGKLSRASRQNLWKLVSLPIPGGGQLATSLEGLLTVLGGGRRMAREPSRFDYRITLPLDQLKAILLGVASTRGYQQYRQRGFKPEPLTLEQRRIRQQLGAMRHRLSPYAK